MAHAEEHDQKGKREGRIHPFLRDIQAIMAVPCSRVIDKYHCLLPRECPCPIDAAEWHYVSTRPALLRMVSAISIAPAIAVDVEHRESYTGQVCLLQISTRDADYVVDTLALGHQLADHLRPLFADASILKVFHGAANDVVWLQRDFGIFVVNLWDTAQACRALSKEESSLAHLLIKYCRVATNKKMQVADWRQRPLPADMLAYARTDSHYLLYIAGRLMGELATRCTGSGGCGAVAARGNVPGSAQGGLADTNGRASLLDMNQPESGGPAVMRDGKPALVALGAEERNSEHWHGPRTGVVTLPQDGSAGGHMVATRCGEGASLSHPGEPGGGQGFDDKRPALVLGEDAAGGGESPSPYCSRLPTPETSTRTRTETLIDTINTRTISTTNTTITTSTTSTTTTKACPLQRAWTSSQRVTLKLYARELAVITPGVAAEGIVAKFGDVLAEVLGGAVSQEAFPLAFAGAVEQICLWRDALALLHDEAPRRVLSDDAVALLAATRPPSATLALWLAALCAADRVTSNDTTSGPNASTASVANGSHLSVAGASGCSGAEQLPADTQDAVGQGNALAGCANGSATDALPGSLYPHAATRAPIEGLPVVFVAADYGELVLRLQEAGQGVGGVAGDKRLSLWVVADRAVQASGSTSRIILSAVQAVRAVARARKDKWGGADAGTWASTGTAARIGPSGAQAAGPGLPPRAGVPCGGISGEASRRRAAKKAQQLPEERERLVQKFSCKKPVYSNCRILAPDGSVLCHCDKKKVDWYLSRDLAQLVSSDPPTIQLTFEPKAMPADAKEDFYTQSKVNQCVGCGEQGHYLRYRVIPCCYRQHFPVKFKSHRSHDIVLLCIDCHEVAMKGAERLKRAIAEEFGVPLQVEEERCTLVGAEDGSSCVAVGAGGVAGAGADGGSIRPASSSSVSVESSKDIACGGAWAEELCGRASAGMAPGPRQGAGKSVPLREAYKAARALRREGGRMPAARVQQLTERGNEDGVSARNAGQVAGPAISHAYLSERGPSHYCSCAATLGDVTWATTTCRRCALWLPTAAASAASSDAGPRKRWGRGRSREGWRLWKRRRRTRRILHLDSCQLSGGMHMPAMPT
eukprot:jgi/Mesvir1/15644/Mv03249-RA.1